MTNEALGGAEPGGNPSRGLGAISEQLARTFDSNGVNTTAARLLLQQLAENAQVFPDNTEECWYHGEIPPHENKPPRAIFLLEHTDDSAHDPFWLRIFYSSDLPPSPHELQEVATRKALRPKLVSRSPQNVARSLIAATYILPSRQQTINVTPNPEYL